MAVRNRVSPGAGLGKREDPADELDSECAGVLASDFKPPLGKPPSERTRRIESASNLEREGACAECASSYVRCASGAW